MPHSKVKTLPYDKDSLFDCAIIGCGPAGSNLGKILSEHGLRVAILDRRLEIGSPLRADGVVNVHDLKRAGINPEEIVQSRIKSVRLTCGTSHAEMSASGGINDAFNASVETDKLHKEMAALSAMAGSSIFLRTAATGINCRNDGTFDVIALQNGKDAHFQSKLVVLAAGNWNFLHLEGEIGAPAKTRSIFENYCRKVTGHPGERAELNVISRPHISMGLEFPFSASMTDCMELEMATGSRQMDLGAPYIIRGQRIVSIPSVPQPVQFGFPVIGMQSGIWNPLFLTGFAQAVETSSVLASIILDHIHDGSRQISDIYAKAADEKVMQTISGEVSLFDALERSSDEKISMLLQEISQLNLSEVSLNEIIRKSGLHLNEIIDRLLAPH